MRDQGIRDLGGGSTNKTWLMIGSEGKREESLEYDPHILL